MKIDKKTIFSLFIVILFVGSLFTMIMYSDRGNSKEYIPTDPNQNFDFVNYTATVDVNVGEVFPQIVIAGTPLDYEEATINSKLLEINGIKNKQVEFRQNQEEINLVITMSVVPEKKMEIIEGVKTLGILENMEAYQYGLLEVPEKINFINDENNEIEYEFTTPKMEGIISIDTLKGDRLEVVVYGIFRGTELIQSRGIEQVNKDNQFQMVMGYETYDILEFKDKIVLETDFNFSEFSYDDINLAITNNMPEAIMQAQVNTPFVFSNGEREEEEITEILKSLNESFEFEINEEVTNIYFESNFEANAHNDLLNEITKTLEENKFEIIELPLISLYLELNREELDENLLLQILNKEKLDLKILATVDTSNMIIAEKEFEYENPETEVYLDYPEDLEKTEIGLSVQGYYQRNKLLFINLSK